MRPITVVFVVLAAVSSVTPAQEIPLSNWTVPPYRSLEATGGMQTMTDITDGVAFVGMQPCRIVDTRGGGVFTGAYGPPNMAAGQTRTFDLNSSPHCTGIPANVAAYSLNFTVTQTAGAPGDIRAWPTGSPPVQLTSVLNWTVVGATLANAIIVPAGTNGAIDVQVAGSGTHLLIDINGYFTGEYNDGNQLVAVGNVASFLLPGFLILGANNNLGGGAYGIWGTSSSPGVDSAGVGGWATATTTTGRTFGVVGFTQSTANHAAGVFGTANGDLPYGACVSCLAAGVYGRSFSGPGVLGVSASAFAGVVGIFTDTAGAEHVDSLGYLGYTANIGVRADNDISKGGTVSFTEPHPSDASKKITYVALEGNEAGTYFRGRGRFQNGQAVIDVPEDFRMVTSADGLSVQVTPIGHMATVAVEDLNLDRIVIRGSRNVEFFYTVNGVRRGYESFLPIGDNDKDYIPKSPDTALPADLRPEIRRRLIANGTYQPDGTVNMETARRLGWDKEWEKRARPAPEPVFD